MCVAICVYVCLFGAGGRRGGGGGGSGVASFRSEESNILRARAPRASTCAPSARPWPRRRVSTPRSVAAGSLLLVQCSMRTKHARVKCLDALNAYKGTDVRHVTLKKQLLMGLLDRAHHGRQVEYAPRVPIDRLPAGLLGRLVGQEVGYSRLHLKDKRAPRRRSVRPVCSPMALRPTRDWRLTASTPIPL
jgi:hypothetical protein